MAHTDVCGPSFSIAFPMLRFASGTYFMQRPTSACLNSVASTTSRTRPNVMADRKLVEKSPSSKNALTPVTAVAHTRSSRRKSTVLCPPSFVAWKYSVSPRRTKESGTP